MVFTHLHVHSHYSLLDGLPTVPQLVARAKALGFTSLALTDHGVMYGIIEFYQECIKAGIKPIIGVELYVAQRGLVDRQPRLDDKPYHLIVLAETFQGYQNLLHLVSTAHLQGYYYKPRVDLALLEQYHNGLIALSGCLSGPVSRAVLQRDLTVATGVIERYQNIFGKDNFFLEVQHNPHTPEQNTVNDALRQLSLTTGAGLVATADSHYLEPTDAEAQDILVCIQTKKQLSDTNRLSMRQEDFSLSTETEMTERLGNFPDAILNTAKIAERCNVTIELGKNHMPFYALPEGHTADQALRDLCVDGIPKRYGTAADPAVQERLDYELSVIAKTGFASYFLIVQDFVNWAKQQGIVVGPGRGSAAGSIVAYLAGITNIDPIRYDLLFERFLNPERVSMPDIDLDFADTRREEVIRYVESKYGKEHVAQIITFGTMAARAAVRDVGRALGLTYGFCDMVAKLVPQFSGLQEALDTVPELQQLYQSDTDAIRLLDAARKLEGVVRHTSTHACGVVITEKPLEFYTPVQYSSSNDLTIVTQYSLHPIEQLGLLKMDFLGLKNLTIIEDTIQLIAKTTDTTIDLETLPLNDKPTYKLLQAGRTTGIFQLESSGMKRYLRELKPTEFEDIIAMVALYRPGPMERIPEYIAGKHGKREVTYVHQALRPVLEKTYGILVYQEQVMALVRAVAGFTAGEGYLLIKAVAKKIEKLLDEQKSKFISGCEKNGISQRIAEQIWEFIEPFAHYGFNKSHSTGYALIAYQTAYLKAHYPAQFMASLLTSDQADAERIAIEVQETRDLHIAVMSPDVNESFSTFTVVKDSLDTDQPRIRFGLAAIKNVGQNLVHSLIAERKDGGPFLHIEDFLRRIQHKDLNKKSLESLIKSGACTAFGEAGMLLHNLDTLLQYNKQAQQDRLSGQGNLFGQSATSVQAPKLYLETAPNIPQPQLLQWEKDLLGLYVSGHPLEKFQAILPAGFSNLADLSSLKANTEVHCLALVELIKRVTTKNGDPMLFVRIEDSTDSREVVVFPKVLAELKTLLHDGMIVQVDGKVSKRNGECSISAESIQSWPDHFVHITISADTPPAAIQSVKAALVKYTGTLPVYMVIKSKTMAVSNRIHPDAVPVLQELLGQDSVRLI